HAPWRAPGEDPDRGRGQGRRRGRLARLTSAAGERLEGRRGSVDERLPARLGGPPGGVRDHPSDVRVEIGRMRLVTRPEVEDPTPTTPVAAAAPEHPACLAPPH